VSGGKGNGYGFSSIDPKNSSFDDDLIMNSQNMKHPDPDLRIRDFLSKNKTSEGAWLMGFPCDIGVSRNNGRKGASRAPDLIRERLFSLTPHPKYYTRHTELLGKVFDHGDLEMSSDLEENQKALSGIVSECLDVNVIPVIFGGGHETSYGHFLGYTRSDREVSVINIDAHTDVRPLKEGKGHSGSPFRQVLDHGSFLCKDYSVFGLNPESVSRDHFHFVSGKGGELRFRDETDLKSVMDHLKNLKTNSVMVTMDMDAVSQSDAPGVSAPAARGITSDLWLKLAFEFGKNRKVTSFDLCEVNPEYDTDNQTVRLAALTVWYFLLGVALREKIY
jgi:formiminoglutamase